MNSPKVKAANLKRRKAKRSRQATEMAELRAKVFERAGGKGELCEVGSAPFLFVGHNSGVTRNSGVVDQLCHLNGGIGRRRQQQSLEGCVAEHDYCHRALDSRPTEWIERVKAHCARYSYHLPERFRILEAKQLQGIKIKKATIDEQKGVTNG